MRAQEPHSEPLPKKNRARSRVLRPPPGAYVCAHTSAPRCMLCCGRAHVAAPQPGIYRGEQIVPGASARSSRDYCFQFVVDFDRPLIDRECTFNRACMSRADMHAVLSPAAPPALPPSNPCGAFSPVPPRLARFSLGSFVHAATLSPASGHDGGHGSVPVLECCGKTGGLRGFCKWGLGEGVSGSGGAWLVVGAIWVDVGVDTSEI